MNTSLLGPNAMSRVRVFLIATCIIAVTPRLSADIILVSRLSDAHAQSYYQAPPQSQTNFLPANLVTGVYGCCALVGCATAVSSSNSSILINSGMEGLRVVGDGGASVYAGPQGGCGYASAKVIVLTFTLTDVPYPYSMTGQLNSSYAMAATATLTGETGTIFERNGTTTLSESGTLPPGNYTLSVQVNSTSDANFIFELDGPVSVSRSTNLSTRLLVGTGNDVGIGGFIVTGSPSATSSGPSGGPRHFLLRGIGPWLSQFGLNFLADPVLELHGPSGFTTITNDNWRDTQEAEIIATGRAPSDDLESAILADLAPGAYTAILAGNAGTTGVGLVEIYDLSTNQESRLANISTRGNVRTGDDIVIAGFILEEGSVGTTIVRGLGPSLSGTGVNALADPKLELRDPQGALIASDDDWMDGANQAAIVETAGLAPSDHLESAIVAILLPGPYTALLSGVNNETGVGLVEVYNDPTIGPLPTPTPSPSPTPTPTPSPTPGVRTCTENFDGVTAPVLPVGWVASNPIYPNGTKWQTSTNQPNSGPNCAFVSDDPRITDKVLDRMSVTIGSASAVMSFRNNFDTEFSDGTFWDGYVLEVSVPTISNGDFLDITDSHIGGSFVSGGYTGTLSTKANNPLAGRMAWSASSGGYIDTVINMGPNLAGQTVTLRFRMGTDVSVGAQGVRIDNLHIDGASCQ